MERESNESQLWPEFTKQNNTLVDKDTQGKKKEVEKGEDSSRR